MTGDCRRRAGGPASCTRYGQVRLSARVQRIYLVPRIRHFKFYVCVHTAVLGMRMAWGRRTLPLYGRELLHAAAIAAHCAWHCDGRRGRDGGGVHALRDASVRRLRGTAPRTRPGWLLLHADRACLPPAAKVGREVTPDDLHGGRPRLRSRVSLSVRSLCWLAVSCETFLVPAYAHFAWERSTWPSTACTKQSAQSHSQSAFARGLNGGGGDDVPAVLGE